MLRKSFSFYNFSCPQVLEKVRRNGNGNGNGVAGKTRAKGVPQNFGYIKRSNGSAVATEIQTNVMMNGGKTAHVSAVPRSNKLKVSGGTQTATGDFQQSRKHKMKKKKISKTIVSSRTKPSVQKLFSHGSKCCSA